MELPNFSSTYTVSDEQIAFYQQNGYVQFDNVLSPSEVAVLQTAMDRAKNQRDGFVRDLGGGKDGNEAILQMLNLWQHHPEIKQYLFGGRIAQMAAALTNSSEIRIYHDQALIKEPGPSAPSPWHQDQPYWPSKEGGMLSCWMALDDVTIDRGCMQFIPGSHHWGEFDPIEFTGDGPGLMDLISAEQRAAWKPQAVELKAGSCTFHHGLCFHYAAPNTTEFRRRALVAIFIPDGITYAADEKMSSPFDNTITAKKGEALRGSDFAQLL